MFIETAALTTHWNSNALTSLHHTAALSFKFKHSEKHFYPDYQSLPNVCICMYVLHVLAIVSLTCVWADPYCGMTYMGSRIAGFVLAAWNDNTESGDHYYIFVEK